MRIISDFRDYYDGVQATGIDPSLVYLRETHVVSVGDGDPARLFDSRGWGINLSPTGPPVDVGFSVYARFEPVAVGFCVRRYVGWSLASSQESERIAFTPDAVAVALAAYPRALEAFETGTVKPCRRWARRLLLTRKSMAEWLEANPQGQPLADQVFRDKGAPTFVTRGARLESRANAPLGPLGFAAVVPPFQAYQDLAAYVDGVLGRDVAPMVAISDRDQIVKKGFDLVTSFRRTSPGPRKERRAAS